MEETPKFTMDNLLGQMCISSTWLNEFDLQSATYTEYWSDGQIRTRTVETIDVPMDTPLELFNNRDEALEQIRKFTDNDDVMISAMHNHDTFAMRKDGDCTIIVGWNNRNR